MKILEFSYSVVNARAKRNMSS